MKYPVAIFKDPASCYGVSVPDLPGCNSAGETMDEALQNVEEAILGHLEILMEDGTTAPLPSDIETHIDNPDFEGARWAFVDVDVVAFLGGTEKITISIPRFLNKKIESLVSEGHAKNKSAFIAESCFKNL